MSITYIDAKSALKILGNTYQFFTKNPEKWVKGYHFVDKNNKPVFFGHPGVYGYDLTGALMLSSAMLEKYDIYFDYVIQRLCAVSSWPTANLSTINDACHTVQDILELISKAMDQINAEAVNGRLKVVR